MPLGGESRLSSAPRIALIVDHPQRDLAGLVLTAVALCQRGVTCHLVPLNLQSTELFGLAPDFVVLNFIRRGTEALATGLGEAGIGLGLLDTEGIVWAEYKDYTELLWQDAGLRGRVDPLCMWGEKLTAHLAKTGLIERKRMRVTGCPRFDFYAPRWRVVLENGGDRTPGILLNTQYSMTNPRFSTVEQHIKDFQSQFGWSRDSIETKMAIEREAVALTLTLARDLARDFPHVRLIVRPHPHEDPAIYRQAVEGCPNVRFSVGGPVHPEIFGAAAVIQRNCTTAVEAGLAGVPALSPEWIPSWFRMELADRVSLPTSTYPEMRDRLQAILAGDQATGGEKSEEICAVVREWFCANDGLAYQRVADTVLERAVQSGGVDRAHCNRFLHGLSGAQEWSRAHLGRRVRHALRLPVDFSFRRLRSLPSRRWTSTDKYFGAKEVADLAARIRAARAGQGLPTRPIGVRQSRDAGEYLGGYAGHSVTMRPE